MRKKFYQLQQKCRQLQKDCRGLAYLEFILALPVLLLLFVGAVDVTRLVILHQKLDRATFTMADLTTQLMVENVCGSLQNWRQNVVEDILRPFSLKAEDYGLRVTSMVNRRVAPGVDVWQPRREWVYPYGQSISSRIGNGAVLNPPGELLPLDDNERTILVETRYLFNPILFWNFDIAGTNVQGIGRQPVNKYIYMRGRAASGEERFGSGFLSRSC